MAKPRSIEEFPLDNNVLSDLNDVDGNGLRFVNELASLFTEVNQLKEDRNKLVSDYGA